MTIRKRDAKLLLILLGVVILLIGYFAVYSPYSALADDVASQTDALRPQLTKLQGYEQNLGTYRTGTAKASSSIGAELKRYPADVRPEDMVMYAETLRTNFALNIKGISFGQPAPLLRFKGIQAKGSAIGTRDLTAYRRSMTITCDLSYQKMKDMIDYINSTGLRASIESITVSYDAGAGRLTGDAVLDQYFITGGGDKYTATQVPDTPLGKSDLFGTISPGS